MLSVLEEGEGKMRDILDDIDKMVDPPHPTCFTGTKVQILKPPLSQLDAINSGEEERDEGCASLDTDTDAADSHADAHVCSIWVSDTPVCSFCIFQYMSVVKDSV